jgi:hypothetical protein
MHSFSFLSHRYMKMKFTLLLTGLLLSAATFSQTGYGIKKVYAYYEEHMPGNIPVGEDGKPMKKYPTVVHHIFVETTSKTKIDWKTAWKDGKSYSISKKEITEFPLVVGKKKSDQEEVKINPSKGNKLWELQLTAQEKATKSPLKTKRGEIILQGIYNGKKIYKRIEKENELYVIPSV